MLIKENSLCDCKDCSTQEENTKQKESHDEDDDGVISSDTSYSNGIHTSGDNTDEDETTVSISHAYCKYCNTEEEDSDEEQSNNKEDDGVISPNTSYSNGIHTSGDDTEDEDIINILTQMIIPEKGIKVGKTQETTTIQTT